MQDMYEPALT